MKKLLFLPALIGAFLFLPLAESKASHYSAGEVFYEWIGDEPGKGQFDYRVFATIYRNVQGVQIGTGNLNACAYRPSNASSQISITLNYQTPNAPLNPLYRMTANNVYGWVDIGVHPRDPNGWDIPAFEGCANSPKDISEYRYVGEVTLSGRAGDWKFAIFPPCCRDQNDNLAGAGSLYIEVDLNNLRGPNSSPRIITPAARAFCVLQAGQKPFEWFQTAGEKDGDSLRYGFYADGSQQGSQCGNFTQIPYSAPYTASSPLPSNPPVQINQRMGVFTLSPSAQGSFVVKIEVRELRFDTTSLQWLYIGNTVRELQVPIAAACKQEAEDGPELDLSKPSVTGLIFQKNQMDSLRNAYNVAFIQAADSTQQGANYIDFIMPYYTGYDCFDNRMTLDFDVAVKCNTVTPTDFRLIGPDGVARPVDSVDTRCAVNGISYTVDLLLFRPLDLDGNYLLQLRTGNDGNTIENECGYELNPGYSGLVEVTGCPQPTLQLDGLTVQNDVWVRLDWSGTQLNDTNVINTFNHWQIMRADRGDPPQLLAQYDSAQARYYVDSFSNNGYFVDNHIYDYVMFMVYNGKGREWTRFCSNINLLVDSNATNDDQIAVYWNPYNCIPDSLIKYNVYRGKMDTNTFAINWAWEGNTPDTNFTLNKPEADSLTQGTYAVRVIGRNPNGNAFTDSSESNWIYYAINYFPPPPPPEPLGELIIPNVITPNGDMVNDRFYINPPLNGEPYEELSVTVYNRWGQKVFEDSQFHERNSPEEGWDGTGSDGNRLTDGVYYYVIKLNDPLRGESRTIKGNLNILGNLN